MTRELQEADWTRLLRRIQSGKCTPLLGAGACYGALPLGAEVAEYLAQRYGYPFPDRDLVRVAQYAAIQSDPNAPKEDVVRSCGPPALLSILSLLNLALMGSRMACSRISPCPS